jgi:hypothetical protein
VTEYFCDQCREAPADVIHNGAALCRTCRAWQAKLDVRRAWQAVTFSNLYRQWEAR